MKYCSFLNNGINFHFMGINFCNKLWQKDTFVKYDDNCIDNFLEKRKNILKDCENNIVPEHCKTCMYLKDIDSSNESQITNSKISNIEINHWLNCNCACYYCSNRETTSLKIEKNTKVKGIIDILPFLENLKKRNLLDEKVNIFMVGGEPTLLEEFPDILKFFMDNNCHASILSNGILYEQLIPEVLRKKEKTYLTVSLDCGTRETFYKIKRVDKFDEVVGNLKKYVEESKEASDRIIIKYIILPEINDNKEEIDKWINTCISIGIKNLFVSIEFCHSATDPSKKIIDSHIIDMYNYTKKRITEINPNLVVCTYDFVEKMIEKGSYQI